MAQQQDDSLSLAGVLADPYRRRMHAFISERGSPVSRDEAAAEVGISRKLAAFHLDKLVTAGLLEAHYARLPGRRGPGAGRSSKLYAPTRREVHIAIPPRSYDLVGEILAEAIDTARPDESPRYAARRVASEKGSKFGNDARSVPRSRRLSAERALALAARLLESLGFQPYRDDAGAVALRNCPFHALARQRPELICGVNQAFVAGVLEGLGARGLEASLDPIPDQCCVRLRPLVDQAS